ncbi:MAG: aminopeptidase [Deltaproteobacteria bacterium]|jgi:aspartyl aminopeptidase|nr:aminopeptidase [Deltaproteobacteria bacterium]
MAKDNEKDQNSESKRNIWERVTPREREKIEAHAENYMNFLTVAKTERKVLDYVVDILRKEGFSDLGAGDGFSGRGGYLVHHGKLVGIFVPGKSDPAEGFNLIVAHGDSPRLDLKPRCVYEDGTFAMLKTNLYGGLKKFQWLARPVALWGFTALKDGRTMEFTFGEDPNEPVLTITDILPHMDRKIQREKRLSDAFPAEKLNILAASIPPAPEETKDGKDAKDAKETKDKADKGKLKNALLKILENKWGIREDDLISSEIEVVPAGPARTVGLDGSFIGSYGQDDRLSVHAALTALLGVKNPTKPLLLIIFDREEIGNYGSTGAQTNFVLRLAGRAFEAGGTEPRHHAVLEALARTSALSADVECGQDPTFKEITDDLNSARLTFGPCLTRYTGGAAKYGASEAGAEYMAKVREIYDSGRVIWQNSLIGKQEEGGGGTVALTLAAYGINIVDSGAPVLSMHSPFEISSKADVWMTANAYRAFYQKA